MIYNHFMLFSQDGQIVPVAVNVGDKVLLPEYGGTKVEFDEEVCLINVLLVN